MEDCRLVDDAGGIAKANLPEDAGLTPKPVVNPVHAHVDALAS